MILGELYKLKARKTIARTPKTVTNQIIILLERNTPITLTSTMPSTRQIVIIPRTMTPLNWFVIMIPALVPLLNPLIRPLRTPPQV
jgi:predicted metal-binding membrane protein